MLFFEVLVEPAGVTGRSAGQSRAAKQTLNFALISRLRRGPLVDDKETTLASLDGRDICILMTIEEVHEMLGVRTQ